MLEKEFKYFKDNQTALYAEYPDKYIVIKDERVLFSDDTFEKALSKAVEGKLEVGTFIVQLCSVDESGYTQTFHSRVIFAQ